MFLLLAWAGGSVSCGLIRLPFRVAGHVTRGTIHAGESAYRKSKEGIAKHKRKREARKEEKKKEKAGDGGEYGARPRNGGLLPDLPPLPDAEAPAPPAADSPPPDDGGYSEPALPGLPE